MKRILVIGSPGSGKSTLAKKIHEILDIELIYLDKLYWKPGWVETERNDFIRSLNEIMAKEHWIIDGHYSYTLPLRLQKADTVIWLDFSTWRCLFRIIKRNIQFNGKSRESMTEGCPEQFNVEFYHYVIMFNYLKRRSIVKLLQTTNNKNIIAFRKPSEAYKWLNALSGAK